MDSTATLTKYYYHPPPCPPIGAAFEAFSRNMKSIRDIGPRILNHASLQKLPMARPLYDSE